MSVLRLTYEETGLLFLGIEENEECAGFKVIEKSEWRDEGKYQYRDVVFQHDGKIWMFTVERSGSYFGDYYFDYRENGCGLDAVEVEKVLITTHEWRKVG